MFAHSFCSNRNPKNKKIARQTEMWEKRIKTKASALNNEVTANSSSKNACKEQSKDVKNKLKQNYEYSINKDKT